MDTMRYETAIHEAGHVVAAIVTGQPFEYATIKPDPETRTFGHVAGFPSYLDAKTLKRQREMARIEAVGLLAGPLAAAHSAEIESDLFWDLWRVRDASQEYEEAEETLRDVYDSLRRVREVLGEAITQARQLVEEHWTAIEALADALVEYETISYADACQIIRAARS